jgi:hypothetical protein
MENKNEQDILNFLTKFLGKKEIMENQIEFMSLYDYLGRAAGSKLGKQVFNYSKKLKITTKSKHVKHDGYDGIIICYPVDFLKSYFYEKEKFNKHEQYIRENKQYFE